MAIVYELVECLEHPGEFVVEGIDYDSEGEVYRTVFERSKSQERAVAYLAFVNDVGDD